MAVAGNGDFIVVWSGDRPASGLDVLGQRYDRDGTALGSTFLVNTYTTNGQRFPAVAVAGNGDFVVAWQS